MPIRIIMKKSLPAKSQDWRTIGGKRKYFRSKWEANFARYLQWQKSKDLISDWLHEPQTFWFEGIKRGCVSYLPDFKIIHADGKHEWIEVKGYMDPKSATKLKRFKKYFPTESIHVIGSEWFKANGSKLSKIIPGWE